MSYEVAIKEDPAVASISDDHRRRETIALFDLAQLHLSDFDGGAPRS